MEECAGSSLGCVPVIPMEEGEAAVLFIHFTFL